MTCKYCNKPEDKQNKPGLKCEKCASFVHLTCLRRPGTPGDFDCDVFFDFKCEDCSLTNKEIFTRNKFAWVHVIFLTLHHLANHSGAISNNGYFHYKTHICSFIDRNWKTLFGENSKQKKNWVGTIAGALSIYSHIFFKSGSVKLKEAGWWKLQHSFSPAVAAHIMSELSKDKPKVRVRNHLALDKANFVDKVIKIGYKDLINDEEHASPEPEVLPLKKRRIESDEMSGVSSTSFFDQIDSDSRFDAIDGTDHSDEMLMLKQENSYSDMENIFKGISFTSASQLAPSDSSSLHSYSQSGMYYDSDSYSGSPYHQEQYSDHSEDKTEKNIIQVKVKKPLDEKLPIRRESRFSAMPNSIDLPWMENPEPKIEVVEMSYYEEVQLLKQVENIIPKVKDPNKKAYLHGLKAKLALRRLKRHKHLPVFDLDKVVKILGGYITENDAMVANSERVLDRFQRSYVIDNLCGTIASSSYSVQLVSQAEPLPFRSAYSGALLKPYIRRDADARPTWMRLTDELLLKTNRHIEGYKLPRHATIDYSYVRPQHIVAVNNLCAQFFWPGIDLTEALQYPEFSCVVTYKKLVIGCAFLVPDVGPNEAYISFILIRPEWRKAKIASFMLYHLLQTCTDKDVTLHVSPSNPAIFLYQKFGFKVEELIQDFYEKYYDIDFKGSRHALFLRLTR